MAKVEKKVEKKVTKKDTVLKYLKSHKSGITKAQAQEKLGIDNIASVVTSIRRSGIEVSCEKVVPKKGDPYFVYKLV